jgi:hypothetical protein
MCRLKPVWTNTYWIKNALDLCAGIWKHGAEIPPQHHHFFALVQEFALRSAVLDTCKLYDHSNRRFAKHTIPDLLQYARRITSPIPIFVGLKGSSWSIWENASRTRG